MPKGVNSPRSDECVVRNFDRGRNMQRKTRELGRRLPLAPFQAAVCPSLLR